MFVRRATTGSRSGLFPRFCIPCYGCTADMSRLSLMSVPAAAARPCSHSAGSASIWKRHTRVLEYPGNGARVLYSSTCFATRPAVDDNAGRGGFPEFTSEFTMWETHANASGDAQCAPSSAAAGPRLLQRKKVRHDSGALCTTSSHNRISRTKHSRENIKGLFVCFVKRFINE